ncbi:MAG: hypothetical protein AAF826_05765 [Pseudomonadota bacterium]
MSTDLSKRKFTDSAQNGAFSWLFEGFRTRMRDTASRARMHAAWKNWPAVHSVAKALHETLVTDRDIQALRQRDVSDLTKRLSLKYPTPDRFPAVAGDMQKWRQDIALMLGISGTDDPDLLDDVIAAYEAENGAVIAVAEAAQPYAYHTEKDGWEALNQAVGGDLWSDPQKAAIVRDIDAATAGASWDDFHAEVVRAISERAQTAELTQS